jgi:hypothetical protein
MPDQLAPDSCQPGQMLVRHTPLKLQYKIKLPTFKEKYFDKVLFSNKTTVFKLINKHKLDSDLL